MKTFLSILKIVAHVLSILATGLRLWDWYRDHLDDL